MFLICSFQLRCWPIWIPRYFTLLLISIFWSLLWKLRCLVICFLFGLNITSSVLSTFKLILLDLNHWTIRERSWLMCLFIFFYRFINVLFAKCCIWPCLIDLCRSLMNIINKSGPNTDPYGTLRDKVWSWVKSIYWCELDSLSQIWVKPIISLASNSIVCKFTKENIMIHCVKSFFKI